MASEASKVGAFNFTTNESFQPKKMQELAGAIDSQFGEHSRAITTLQNKTTLPFKDFGTTSPNISGESDGTLVLWNDGEQKIGIVIFGQLLTLSTS